MGTTSPQAAIELLDRLRRENFPGAILHGIDRLEAGDFGSDLDLACHEPMAHVLRQVECASETLGLVPVLLWPYDVNSVTVLVVRPQARRPLSAVQIDLLVDPEGLGKYGVRTGLLLREAETAGLFPAVSPLDRALYLWRKSRVKSQQARLREAEAALRTFPAQQVRGRVGELFSWGPVPLSGAVRGARTVRLRRVRARSQRLLWRLMTPIGRHLDGLPDEARESLVGATQGVFPHVLERRSPIPFAWTPASRRPLLALSSRPTPAGAEITPSDIDTVVLRLHEGYLSTSRRYVLSRLV